MRNRIGTRARAARNKGPAGYRVLAEALERRVLLIDPGPFPSGIGASVTNPREGTTLTVTLGLWTPGGSFPASSLGLSISGTATNGQDYDDGAGNPISSSVSLPAWGGSGTGVTATFPVRILRDNLVEPAETIVLDMGWWRPGPGAPITLHYFTTITITDDPPIVSISAVQSGAEGGPPLKYHLSRTGGDTSSPLTVLLAREERSTAEPADFADIPASIALLTSAELSISAVQDGILEPTESLWMQILPDPNHYLIGTSEALANVAGESWSLWLGLPDAPWYIGSSTSTSTGGTTVTWNHDDDNANRVLDADDAASAAENDLLAVTVGHGSAPVSTSLSWSGGIRLWDSPSKQNPLTPGTWSGAGPSVVYIEGITPSEQANDACFTVSSSGGGGTSTVVLNLTVAAADLEVASGSVDEISEGEPGLFWQEGLILTAKRHGAVSQDRILTWTQAGAVKVRNGAGEEVTSGVSLPAGAADTPFSVEPLEGLDPAAAVTFTLALADGSDSDVTKLWKGADLVAHRTGGKFGETVSQEIEDEGDPGKYLILANNDFEEEAEDGGRDYDNEIALIPEQGSEPVDDDLARITLRRLAPWFTSGTVRIELSDPSAVRLFKGDGTLLYQADGTHEGALTWTIGAGSGYLAGLSSSDVDVWMEGVSKSADFTFSLVYSDTSAAELARDSVHVTIAEFSFIDADGEEVYEVVPVWKDELTWAAGAPTSEYAVQTPGQWISGIAYRARMDGLQEGISPTFTQRSDLYQQEYFADEMARDGTALVSSHYAVLYSSDRMTGCEGDEPLLTTTEKQTILSQLGVHALHNDGATTQIATTQDVQEHAVAVRAVSITLANTGMIASGNHMTGTVTVNNPRNLDWVIRVDHPDLGIAPQFFNGNSAALDVLVNGVLADGVGRVFVHVRSGPNARQLLEKVEPTQGADISAIYHVNDTGVEKSAHFRSAWWMLANPATTPMPADAVSRNRRITQLYGEMYNANRTWAKWAGMAAFASRTVGQGMAMADMAQSSMGKGIVRMVAPDAQSETLRRLLAKGNVLVYLDLYPQHLAFRDGGLAAVQGMPGPEVVPTQRDAWQLVSNGVGGNDQAMVWQGNKNLLSYEQNTFLQQKIYNNNEAVFAPISAGLQSPFAFLGGLGFQAAVGPTLPPGTQLNLADAAQRWLWIGDEQKGQIKDFKAWDQNHTAIDIAWLLQL